MGISARIASYQGAKMLRATVILSSLSACATGRRDPRRCSAFLKAANRTADLVDEGKFHAEVVAALTIGKAATRLVERRDDAFFGGDTAIDAREGRGPS